LYCIIILAHNVESDQAPVTPDYVRGKNYYCGILCYRIPGWVLYINL